MFSSHWLLAGVDVHPGRPHPCIAVTPLHDHAEFKPSGVQFRIPAEAASGDRAGHDVVGLLALWEGTLLTQLRITSQC